MPPTLEDFQQISNRGLQDTLTVDERETFDEGIRRGIITAPRDGTSGASPSLQPPDDLPIGKLDGNGQIPVQPPVQTPVVPDQDAGLGPEALAIRDATNNLIGMGETALTLGTGLGAEILSGLGVLGKTGTEAIKGNLDVFGEGTGSPESVAARQRILDTQSQIREAFTFQPRTETGQRFLKATGEAVEEKLLPIIESTKELSNTVREDTGSNVLATIVEVAPELGLDLLTGATGKGLIAGGKAARKTVVKLKDATKRRKEIAEDQGLLQEVSPDWDFLDSKSDALYKELRDANVGYKKNKLREMLAKMEKDIRVKGGSKRTAPMLTGILRDFKKDIETREVFGTNDLDILREELKAAIRQHQPSGLKAKNILDNFVFNSGPKTLTGPPEVIKTIGVKYDAVRNFYNRKKNSERLSDVRELADLNASKAISPKAPILTVQSELSKIVKPGPKNQEIKFYSESDQQMMKDIIAGKSAGAGAYNFMAGLDPVTGGALAKIWSAVVGGSLATVVGPSGLIVIPMLGKFSAKMTTKLLDKNLDYADAVFRAGEDGMKITTAWRKKNPDPKVRDTRELGELLAQPHVKLKNLPKAPKVQEAKKIAIEMRKRFFQDVVVEPFAGAQATVEALQVPVGQIQLREEQ